MTAPIKPPTQIEERGERLVTPGMLASAWRAWHSRHGGRIGPGPAFVEAIEAALADKTSPITEQARQLAEMRETLHYANGTAELAMNHRDAAEAGAKELREALENARRDMLYLKLSSQIQRKLRHAAVERIEAAIRSRSGGAD